jgi:hypothetical protein
MSRRLASVLLSVAVLGAGTLTTASSPASAATLPTVGYVAQSYGSYISLGAGAVRSGPTSLAQLACTTVAPQSTTGSAAALAVPKVGTVGAVTTSARTYATTTTKNSSSTSKVAGVSLLGGIVRADAITSSTSASIDSAGRLASSHASNIVGLVVNGRSVAAAAPANTQIPLSFGGTRYGTVYVNQQYGSKVGNEYRATTTAIQVNISGTNPLGLPSGTVIQVGFSRAHITQAVRGLVGGLGYSTAANLANGTVASSPQAAASAPCAGGTSSATIASVTIPSLASTGTTQTRTSAQVTSTARSVSVADDTADINVLAGTITARAVNARTSVAQTGTATPSRVDGSGFLGLQVKGFPAIKDNVAPNTVVTVPGLGKVTFHKVVRTPQAVQVTMIEIVLAAPKGSLAAGSVVRIGYTYSVLR